jgi:hypothetical protein
MMLIKYVNPFCGSVGGSPCVEARLEYFHCSLARCRRRQEGNPVPGGKLGNPVTAGHKYRDLVLQVVGRKADDIAL